MTSASLSPLLCARDLYKSFGNTVALGGVTVTVHRGERVVIVGPSGSGKTTLLRCLNFLEFAESGRIDFDGQQYDCSEIAANPRRRRTIRRLRMLRTEIGMVFQHFNLFPHLTVLENVSEGPMGGRGMRREEATQIAVELLSQVGLQDKAQAYPRMLSGGQKQRVAIARALAMRPKAMLFDEITSALDAELVGEVLETMRALAAKGLTMIIVTHELDFARQIADEVIFMDKGMIIEKGTGDDLFVKPQHERTRRFLEAVRNRWSYEVIQ